MTNVSGYFILAPKVAWVIIILSYRYKRYSQFYKETETANGKVEI